MGILDVILLLLIGIGFAAAVTAIAKGKTGCKDCGGCCGSCPKNNNLKNKNLK